ncbi:Heavy metal RND efflux outer membrane protein, CzcC family [Indibacter alkaliphilus LW1]|uniref:Heavy metal RND efflux outer membrane protein, CzcC family n=1 Tax=Indibacter alkaliphilus (strain CCUG 57479 / KCTC 22604 / LW1) TaxID=1189612 RepID=S2DUL8_INDAL|nr:TolC family protein [Indibacter alkaliphilus]EOZ95791.1 Heavy metal RND efflux outer membrane protein, CzcC family [Indibacter alkaliphilus LW1]
MKGVKDKFTYQGQLITFKDLKERTIAEIFQRLSYRLQGLMLRIISTLSRIALLSGLPLKLQFPPYFYVFQLVIKRGKGLMLKIISTILLCISTLFQSLINFPQKVTNSGKGLMLKTISTIFLCISTIFQLQSQTLENYLNEAIENNASLQGSFKQYQASLEKTNQVSLESPQLNIGVFTRPMELLMGNQRAEASVMQMFPWFGMLRTQKDEATLMSEAKYEEFRQQRNVLLYQVKETYFQLQQLQNTIDITVSNLEILKSLEQLAIIRYQGGSTSEAVSSVSSAVRRPTRGSQQGSGDDGMGMGGGGSSAASSGQSSSAASMNSMGSGGGSGKLTDVLRLQVQIKALESDLEQLEVDKRPLTVRFNQLLGRDKNEDVAIESQLESQKAMGWEVEMLEQILDTNPMLLMLEKEGLAYQKQGEMAKLEGKPMFGLGLNYMVFSPRPESGVPGGMGGMDYMPAGMGNNMVMPMATVSLPIYRKKYKAMEAESKLYWEANERQKEDLQRNLETEFETILVSIKDADRKIRLLQDQIELTEQTLELSVTSYATEGSSFEEILSIQRELLDFRLNLLNTKIEREIGFAKLETLIGV